MRTYFILIAILSLFTTRGFTQQVISSGGGYIEDSLFQLSWTLGETITGTVTDGTYTLTQGFQQANLKVTGLEVLNENLFVEAYPNPTSDFLYIKSPGIDNLKAELYSLEGKLLQIMDLNTDISQVDFTGLPSGTYILKVKQKEQVLRSFKVIKTN